MKRRLAVKLNYRKTIVLALVSFMGILSLNYSSGPALNSQAVTGAPFNSGSTCASCHGSGSFAPTISIQLLSGSTPVTTYTAGQSYTVRLTRTANAAHNALANAGFGFQLTCATTSGNTNNNTWGTPLPSNVVNRTLSGRNYIEHNTKLSKTITQLDIPWVAPATNVGNLSFYVALNTVNGDGGTSGDHVVNTSMTISQPCVSAPVVTTNPTSATACASTSVSFTAAATGNPAPLVQWQVSTNGGANWNNIAGATNNTYTFTAAASDNGKQYQAVYTNSCGSATSSAATLTINGAPTITTQPLSTTACANNPVTFTVAANNATTIQWQTSTNGGANFSPITGATNTSYTFTPTSANNTHRYRAFVNGTCGFVFTSQAILTVNSAPVVGTQPSAVTVCAGASASFTASATGTPAPTVQWQVNSDGINWNNIAGATTNTYSFTPTSGSNGNLYRAVYTNSCASDMSNGVLLTVNTPPTIDMDPASAIVCAGTTVNFVSSASGTPTPGVQWEVNNGSGWNAIAGAMNSTYSFTATGADNGNQYRAVYTNTCGSVTTTVGNLTVNTSVTPSVSISASANNICSGTSVTFTATPTSGGSTPGYQWILNGSAIAGATNATYNSSTLSNGDAVTVEMTSSTGCASPATVTSNTITMSVTQLTTNTTSVTACDSYTWTVNGQTYTQGGTYTVVNGCTTDQLNLVINQSSTATETATATGSYTWNGQTYTASGTYTWVGTNAAGCDSTVTLNLTISSCTPTASTETVSACGSYTWHGTTYTSSTNSATWTTTNAAGCDSIITLNLTITPVTGSSTSVSACDDYTWSANGQTYIMSGTYTHTNGCHTDTLMLTVTPSTNTVSTVSSCGSHTWNANGQTYTMSGTYTHTTNCNTDTLHLTVNAVSGDTVTTSACDSYTWSANGQTYTQSGTYTHVVGCHTHTLMVTITPSTSSTTTASACGSYIWSVNGQTYTMSGVYTSATGCSADTLDLTISTSGGVQPTITPDGPTTICTVGGAVTLTASPGASYLWSNGATTQSISVTQGNTFTVEVTEANGCSSTSAPVTVTSKAMPNTAKIKAVSATTVCQPGTVNFVLDMPTGSTTGFSYQWDLDGGSIPGATDSTYNAFATGAYTVTISGGGSCSKTSAAKTATVKLMPTADFTAAGATSFCSGGSVTLNAAAAPSGATYTWLKNGTTNAGSGASKTFTASGDYSLVVTLAGCKDTSDYSELVTVHAAAPTPKVIVIGPSTVCDPATVSLMLDTAISPMGSSFQWNMDGAAIAGATDSTYAADTTGMYSITLTTVNGCTKTSTAKKATVKPLPEANFTAAGPTEFCAGGNVTLNAPVMPGYTYTWLRDGNINAGSGAAKAFKISGVYTLVATLAGCKDTSDYSETITVNPLPIASVTTTDPTTFCTGGSATLHATPTGAFHTYAWYKTNVLDPAVITEDYTATAAGTYKVVVTDDNSCVSKMSTTSVVIKVNPIPAAAITAMGSTTLTPGASVKLKATPTGTGITYQWYVNLQPIAGATGKEYIATAGGDYTVEVTKLGCTGTSPSMSVIMDLIREEAGTTSNPVENAETIFEIGAYPNPVNGMLHVNVRGIEEVNAVLHVMDMNGKLVAMQEMHETSATVDMTSYANGMYLVRYKDTEGRTATIKITKQ